MYHRTGFAANLGTDSTDMATVSFSTMTITDGLLSAISVSCGGDNLDASESEAWRNGETELSGSSAFGYVAGGDKGIKLFESQGTEFGSGYIYMALVFNRKLSPGEQISLWRNPYQFLKPATEVKYFPSPELEILTIPDKRRQASIEFDEGQEHRLIGDFYLNDYPISVGCWFQDTTDSVTNDRNLMQISDTSSPNNQIRLSKNQTARTIQVGHGWTGGGVSVVSTTSYLQNTWNNCVGILIASNSIQITLNDDTPVTDTSEQGNPVGVNELSIGWENDSTPGDPWNGFIAHTFMYKGVMTDSQITQFNQGILPDVIFKHDMGNLFYLPMQEDINHIGGFNSNTMMRFEGTGSGAILQFNSKHPPVQWRKKLPLQITYEPGKDLDGFNLPDPRFEVPSLLIPGRKPTGLVEIDTQHQMGKGLTACWLFTEGVDVFRDLSGNQEDGVLAGAAFEVSDLGNIIMATTDNDLATVPNYTPTDIGSCVIKLKRSVDDGSAMRVLGFHDAFELTISASGDFFVNNFYQAAALTTDSTSTAVVDKWITVISTWNRTSLVAKIYIDGVLESTTSNANDTPTGTPAILTFGNRTDDSATDAFKGEIEFVMFKDYEVDDAEAKQWTDNPYHFLIPA